MIGAGERKVHTNVQEYVVKDVNLKKQEEEGVQEVSKYRCIVLKYVYKKNSCTPLCVVRYIIIFILLK